MNKTEKIRLLAQAIVMLECSYTNKHNDVLKLAKEIALMTDGNPNFCILMTIGQNPEDVHNAINQTLKDDLKIELNEYNPF